MVEKIITVDNVSKNFRLPQEKSGTLKSVFTRNFRHTNKGITTQHALTNISFDVHKGEFFGIVGRNGSGKSTLLKILAGIYQPTEGGITTKGKLVPFIELGVGFNPELTGRDNVYLNGAMLGFSKNEIDSQYDDIVEFSELKSFMDQKLKNYSSGMQVRLAFSMAIRAKADILLVDEVLAVGDADFQRKCFDYFKKLKLDKTTVVFVSHNMDAVREYCDRCVLIEKHKIKMIGDPEVISEEYIKMFNPPSVIKEKLSDETKETEDKRQERWGDGLAQFTEVSIKDITKEEIVIVTKVTANSFYERPIYGILIKNAAGHPICGTNNKILKKYCKKLNSDGDELMWRIPNIFGTGTYTIDVAITHPDGITQSDWWHDATSFRIANTLTAPFIISPAIDVSIQSLN
ncbi:MAG: hypothetical protein NVSMB46_08510 [Candidatus Saccharimonadales bacterium]